MNQATDIFETDESYYERLYFVIKENIQQVAKEFALLNESKQMLDRQRENLESLNTNVSSMFTNVQETVRAAFETIKLAGNLVE